MFPHRDYYRSVTTMRSLPIAIKSSSDNSWTSVLVNSSNSIQMGTEQESSIDSKKEDHLIGGYEELDTIKNRTRIFIKEQFANLHCTDIFTVIFHCINIMQYLIVPYFYAFETKNFWAINLAYWYAIINDLFFLVYVTIRFRQNGGMCEWIWNLILLLPFWLLYEEITERKKVSWTLGNIDLGFFICRCWSYPFKLYWSIHPTAGMIGIGNFKLKTLFLKLGFYMVLVLHGFAIVLGLILQIYGRGFLANEYYMIDNQDHICYWTSLHFAVEMMTQNAAKIPSRQAVNIAIILISVCALCFCIYCETLIFIICNMRNKRIVKLQKFTRTLIKQMHINKNNKMANLLLANHENVVQYKQSVSIMECNMMLKEVNWTMVQELLFDVHLSALKASNIFNFKHKNDPYLRYLSSKMKRDSYNASEHICRKKERIDRMVVIVFGYVQILAEDNITSMVFLGPGTCINQCGLLVTLRAKATVRCVTYVRVLTLSKKDFLVNTLTAFPEMYNLIFNNFKTQVIESRKRRRTMMMRPPQIDTNMADRVNSQLYKVVTENIIALNVKTYKRHVFDENYMLNKMWNYLITLISVIIAIFYPYYAVFCREFPDAFKILAIAMEVLLVADVLLTMIIYDAPRKKNKVFTWHCGFYRRHLLHLFSKWPFYLDFFACIYFEHFTYALNPSSIGEEQITFLYYLCKLNRVVKVYKVFQLLWSMKIPHEFLKRLFIYALRLSMIFYYGAVILYLASCFNPVCKARSWFRLTQIEDYDNHILQSKTDDRFLYSLYTSLMCIHQLDVLLSADTIDIILSLFLTFIGWVYLTYVFVDLTSLQYLQLKPRMYYKQDVADIKSLSQFYKFPRKLHTRLVRYYKIRYIYEPFYFHLYSSHDHNRRYLSRYIAAEIVFSERLAALGQIPLFSTIGGNFLRRLSLHSKSYLLPADDIVTYAGNMNKEMFVLLKGVCICKKNGISWRIYPMSEENPDSHFGTISLFFSQSEEYTVITETPCWLLSIDGSAIQDALRYYPSVNQCLQQALVTNNVINLKVDSNNLRVTTPSDVVPLKSIPTIRKVIEESFVNVVAQCTKNKQVYSEIFANVELCFWRYMMLPVTIIPWGTFFHCWMLLRMLVSFTYGITCPLMFIAGPNSQLLHIINLICDVIIGLEMVILAYLCYTRHNNEVLITHPVLTLGNYAQNSMLIDIILAIPYEWLHIYNNTNDYDVFNILRAIKILQVFKYFVILSKAKLLEKEFVTIASELLKCLSWSVLILNGFSCALIATDCNVYNNRTLICNNQSWIGSSKYHLKGVIPTESAYVLGIYWSTCTMFGISFGDVKTQGGSNLNIMIILIIVGIFLRGYYLKSIVSYSLANSEAYNNFRIVDYQKQLKHVMNFLQKEDVDAALCNKLRDNAVYILTRSHGIKNTILLSYLHTTLLQDTLAFLYEDTLRQVPLFYGMDRSFLRIVALIAKPLHFLPEQVIINVDDVLDEFYIIHTGTIHTELARSSYHINLSTGSILGYFFKDTTSLMSIQAKTITHVDVLCIKSIDYFNMLKNYPKYGKQLKSILSEYKDFMSNKKLENNIVHMVEKDSQTKLVKNINQLFCNEGFHLYLEVATEITACINAILIPLNFITRQSVLIYCNLTIDLVFVLFFVLQFFHPIRFHIKKSEISFDIALNIVLLSSYVIFQYHIGGIVEYPYFYFACIRILGLYRCKFLKKRHYDLNHNLFVRSLIHVFIVWIIVLHWAACIWAILQYYLKQFPSNYAESLLLVFNLQTGISTYRRSFHHGLDQLIIVLFIYTLHIILYFLYVEFIKCFWLRMKHTTRFNFLLKQLQIYLKSLGINKYQVNHISRHLVLLETQDYGNNFPVLLRQLPSPILHSLKATLYQSLLEKSYVFHGTQINFQRNIAAKLLRAVYYKGETIINHGAIDKSMYFIRSGSVEIVTIHDNHTEGMHDVLHAGEMFGLAQGLFKHYMPHQFTFKAQTDVEILSLRLDHWEHLLRHFPKSKDIIYNRIKTVQL